MSTDSIPREVVDATLRTNLPFFAIACLAFVFGISSFTIGWFRSRNRLLLCAGSFSILYAIRLFIQNDLVRASMGVYGHELVPLTDCLTYVIAIPFALFAGELFGRGKYGSIAIWIWIEVAFAAIAIPAALLAHGEHWANLINGILIIGGTLVMLLHVFLIPEDPDSFVRALKWPLLFFGGLVVLTNRGYRLAGVDVEPVGFLVLLAGLGTTSVGRALAKERKLLEVEQELATARRIQNAIIPHAAPEMASVEIATRYQPMTSVAGDFYDFLQTSESRVTILVADVSGHGVPAALVASMLKVCFAAQRDHANDPAEILAGLNAMLRGSLGGQYVTAACAAIDLASGTIIYSAAGHPPTLLLRKGGGEVVQLAENGLFIGPFAQASYSNMKVGFESGDKLVLYTDGIIEAMGQDGKEFGRESLESFLRDTQAHKPTEIIAQLFERIWAPAQQDDLTIVLAQFV